MPATEIDAALAAVPPLVREALEAARASIMEFHRGQLRDDATHERNGVLVRELRRPVDRAGLYVPGGRARYPSNQSVAPIATRTHAAAYQCRGRSARMSTRNTGNRQSRTKVIALGSVRMRSSPSVATGSTE